VGSTSGHYQVSGQEISQGHLASIGLRVNQFLSINYLYI